MNHVNMGWHPKKPNGVGAKKGREEESCLAVCLPVPWLARNESWRGRELSPRTMLLKGGGGVSYYPPPVELRISCQVNPRYHLLPNQSMLGPGGRKPK